LRYDARGHGTSGFSIDPMCYSWDELARDQLALLDALGIDRYIAAGASMGCGTALHAALLAPHRVEALVLVIPPAAWETRRERVEIWEQVASLIEQHGIEAYIAAMQSMPKPDPLLGRDEFDEAFAESARAADPARHAGVFRGAATADLPDRAAIRGITVPTLILAWSGDPGHPTSTAEQLNELLPNSTLSVAGTWDELATWTDRMARFVETRSI
jgi:3-oxoadipate enol-lactonase